MEKTERTYAVIMQGEATEHGHRSIYPPEYQCTVTEADADALEARLCGILDADLHETYKAQQALNEPKMPYSTWKEAYLDYKVAYPLNMYGDESAILFARYSLFNGSLIRSMYLTRL